MMSEAEAVAVGGGAVGVVIVLLTLLVIAFFVGTQPAHKDATDTKKEAGRPGTVEDAARSGFAFLMDLIGYATLILLITCVIAALGGAALMGGG